MSAAVLDLGLEVLTVRTACVHCAHPVHNTGSGKTWIHTLAGTYRCPEYPHAYAEPWSSEDAEAATEKSYEDGFAAGREEAEDEAHENVDNAHGEGVCEGRMDMHSELSEAITEVLAGFSEASTVADVRDVVAATFSRVRP